MHASKERKWKTCPKCKRFLPLDEAFQNDRSQPTGKKSHCRDCRNKKAQTYREQLTEQQDVADDNLLGDLEDAARTLTAIKETRRVAKALEQERWEREGREQRLSSDIEMLRPDDFGEDEDFDTSIANDPSLKAKHLSKKASQEKRQEFSRAMGEHMGAVRRAAVAEATGGDLIEAMPGESGAYIGKLAEQERRFANRRLARSLSLFAAGEEQSRRLWMMACRQYLTGRVQATGYATKKPSKKQKRSVCLLLSDLHLGADLSAAENPMPYRKVEEARRLEFVLRQTIDYKPQYRSDSEFVLLLNGDLIEGMLLHDLRDGAPLTEQKVIFLKYFERFVAELAHAFPSGRIFCQPGNHGRNKLRHPGRATSSKFDGVEWGLYYALSRACAHLQNVTWDLPFRAVSIVDLHGSKLGLTHADTEVKIGDPDTKAKENAQILAEINSSQLYGVEFDAWAFGHFHKSRFQPKKIRSLFNGALIPPNGHARTSGYLGESCGQWLFESVEGFPVGDLRFIEVGSAQDNDERLGNLIVPFRFDLT